MRRSDRPAVRRLRVNTRECYLVSESGRVGVQGDLVREDIQVYLLTAAYPVVGPALLLILDHAVDVSLSDSVEESTQTP